MNSTLAIRAEDLGSWYFRLNGYLATPNFVVHPDEGIGQRTDVDIIGVRFPHRGEIVATRILEDHAKAVLTDDKPCVVLAEVKRGQCGLNGPWRQPGGNLERVLKAVGFLKPSMIPPASEALYSSGRWADENVCVSLFSLGSSRNRGLERDFPEVPQVLWPEALKFIFDRFSQYRLEKLLHDQWPDAGKRLWDYVWEFEDDPAGFIAAVDVTE